MDKIIIFKKHKKYQWTIIIFKILQFNVNIIFLKEINKNNNEIIDQKIIKIKLNKSKVYYKSTIFNILLLKTIL